MATYMEVANSPLLYGLVIVGLVLICLLCAAFFIKTRRRALELGISKETIKKINRSTLLLAIIPSLTIVVGLFALAAILGTPWSWFRLSVIGSVMYELMAGQMAVTAMGYTDVAAATAGGPQAFGAMMFVMSLGILLPPIVNAVVSKSLSQGLQKQGGKGGGFSPILGCCFMMGVFVVMMPNTLMQGAVNCAVLLTSFLIAILIAQVSAKTPLKWLAQFSLPLCLLLEAASSLLWSKVF